ncbi:MAG: hypothetical protein RSD67_08340 [Oscillospiraceae bacterium]
MQSSLNFNVPNGANNIIMLVNDVIHIEPQGKWFSPYNQEPVVINSYMQLIDSVDDFYDQYGMIQPTTQRRSLLRCKSKQPQAAKEVKKYMSDDIFEKQIGEKGTFIIQVKYRQHSSWQGSVEWVETGEKKMFRSTMELIKMIDEALEKNII